jgi:ribosome maturation factor RimP
MLKVGFICPLFLFCWLMSVVNFQESGRLHYAVSNSENWSEPDMVDTVNKRVETVALPVLEELGLELVEVQYRREQSGWVLRLIIDKQEDGVSLEDCAAVSREMSQLLDIEDFIEQAYNLEVSSPGLDRPLKSMADFQRFTGRKTKIKTIEPIAGERVFIGRIQQASGETIILEVGRKEVTIPFSQVAKARLEIEF